MLELVGDGGHEPAAALWDEACGHAALAVGVVEEVLDVEGEGDIAEMIAGADVEEDAGREGVLGIQRGLNLIGIRHEVVNLLLIFCDDGGVGVRGLHIFGKPHHIVGQHVDSAGIDTIREDVEIGVVLASLETDMGMETEVARGLPGYDAVGGDDGDVERVVVGGVCLFVLTDVLNGGVEVCRPAPTLVFSGEFESVGIDETSVGMFDELRDDEVLGVVVECVDLKVESGNPLCGSEGELQELSVSGSSSVAYCV